MYTLTKEQKLSNLKEVLENLKNKKVNIEEQISNIEKKIGKLESSSASNSNDRDLPPDVQALLNL